MFFKVLFYYRVLILTWRPKILTETMVIKILPCLNNVEGASNLHVSSVRATASATYVLHIVY